MSGGGLPTLLHDTTPPGLPVKFISLKSNPDRALSNSQKRLTEAPFPLGFWGQVAPLRGPNLGFSGSSLPPPLGFPVKPSPGPPPSASAEGKNLKSLGLSGYEVEQLIHKTVLIPTSFLSFKCPLVKHPVSLGPLTLRVSVTHARLRPLFPAPPTPFPAWPPCRTRRIRL